MSPSVRGRMNSSLRSRRAPLCHHVYLYNNVRQRPHSISLLINHTTTTTTTAVADRLLITRILLLLCREENSAKSATKRISTKHSVANKVDPLHRCLWKKVVAQIGHQIILDYPIRSNVHPFSDVYQINALRLLINWADRQSRQTHATTITSPPSFRSFGRMITNLIVVLYNKAYSANSYNKWLTDARVKHSCMQLMSHFSLPASEPGTN